MRGKFNQVQNRLELAVQAAELGLWDWNIEKDRVEFNSRWAEMLGYDLKEIDNSLETWKELIHEEDQKRVFSELQKHLNGETSCYETEHRLKTRSGSYKWVYDIGKVLIRDDSGNPVRAVGIHLDIDEKKKSEQKIKYLSFHNQLTGLYNRRYFENEIERLNQSRRLPISIVVMDMDGLKSINDRFGHRTGDEFIKKAGSIFKESFRKEDVVARIGGDEFSVILPETDLETSRELCSRVQQRMKQFNENRDLPVPIKISLGTAVMQGPNQDLNQVFDEADRNMYHNKGRRRQKLS